MKRQSLLLLGWLLLATPAVAIGPYPFTFTNNNGTITITGYTGPHGAVDIPDTIGGLPVTSIGDYAFEGDSMTSVTIPDSVTSIGLGAFEECTSLTSVTIPNGVTSIGDYLFWACTGLSSVTIPNSVTSIGGWTFAKCLSLTNVTIGNSVTNIGADAFFFCPRLTAVQFQGNAPSFGLDVFTSSEPTAYYLPGTTGWGLTFAGIPTATWKLPYPLILNSSPSADMRNNGFGFTVSWATNLTVVVEASPGLANPVWTPLATKTLGDTRSRGWFYFSDPQWTNHAARFYRIRSQ